MRNYIRRSQVNLEESKNIYKSYLKNSRNHNSGLIKSFSDRNLSDVDLLLTGSMKKLQNPYECNHFQFIITAKINENMEELNTKNLSKRLHLN